MINEKNKEKKEEKKEKYKVLLSSKTMMETNEIKEKSNILLSSKTNVEKNEIKDEFKINTLITEKIEEKYEKYENLLLNKVNMEYMHNRYLNKFSYIKGLRSMLQSYHDICIDFSKKISSINAKFIFDNITRKQKPINNEKEEEKLVNNMKEKQIDTEYDILTDSVNTACNKIYDLMVTQGKSFESLAKFINSILSNSNPDLILPKEMKQFYLDKKGKELNNKYKTILKQYFNTKVYNNKYKKEYEINFDSLEKMCKESQDKKGVQNKIKQKINNEIII